MSLKDELSQHIVTNIIPTNDTSYHLGMSEIGHPCERHLWFKFRHASAESFDTRTLLKFADGHRCEEAMANLIKAERRQERRTLFGGWFSGSIDGVFGDFIWEHKASDKLDAFRKAKTLKAWNEKYYAQAVMYMHVFDAPSHVITVSNHGFTDWDCKETEPDTEFALELIEKARRVIFNDRPPAYKEIFDCQWCSQRGVCAESEIPQRNCRTCARWTPLEGGQHCAHFDHTVIGEFQFQTQCPHHQFNPYCVPGELTADGTYQLRNGESYEDKQ